MNLGGIRFTGEVTRRGIYDAVRLAGRVSTARRRVRRIERLVFVFGIVFIVLTVAVPTDTTSGLADGLRAMSPLRPVPVLVGISSIDRVWAWFAARRAMRPFRADPYVDVRVDETGIEVEHRGVSTRLDWSAVTVVAESDAMLVCVVDHRRRLQIVSVPWQGLRSSEVAAIRVLAREAPGERRWVTVPGRRPPSRLRIVSSAGTVIDAAPEPLRTDRPGETALPRRQVPPRGG